MINLLILTLIVLATSVVNAFIDNYLIKKKWGKVKNLNHKSRTSIRFLIFGISYCLLTGLSMTPPETLWKFIKVLGEFYLFMGYCFLLFNITFDPLLNHLRSLPWYYDGKDAITDQMSQYLNSGNDEILAYIELGIKILIILGLEVWILLM